MNGQLHGTAALTPATYILCAEYSANNGMDCTEMYLEN
jgi:hypothetical protein